MGRVCRFVCISVVAVLLLFLIGCGGNKPYDEQLLGTWEYEEYDEYHDETDITSLVFHDDGRVSRRYSYSHDYDWYCWEIIDETSLELRDDDGDFICMYDVEIKNGEMTLTLIDWSGGNPFGENVYIKTD